MSAFIASLWIVILGQLSPIHTNIRMDDFLSVSCPKAQVCMLLDQAGQLYYSADGGSTLRHRASLSRHELRKVVFSSLLLGWAIDHRGHMWRSRNGGRTFELCMGGLGLKPGDTIKDLTLDHSGRLVFGTSAGEIRSWQADGTSKLLGNSDKKRLVKLHSSSGQTLLALSRDGTVLKWNQGSGRSVYPPRKDSPRILGLAGYGEKRIITGGCRGECRVSNDGGATWQELSILSDKPVAGLKGSCLKPLGQFASGEIVLDGPPGILIVVDSMRPEARILNMGSKVRFMDAAPLSGSLLLVGQGGSRAVLKKDEQGSLSIKWLQKMSAAVSDMRLFGLRGAVRSCAGGGLSISTDSGGEWLAVPSPDGPARRIQFIDRKRGFALVGMHLIYGTSDGGKSWQRLGHWADLSLLDMSFVDARTGWIVGDNAAVLRTRDGGKTWTLDKIPADKPLLRVQFVDRKNGWLVGGHQTVFRTRDGGSTWTRLLEGRGNLRSLYFLDANNGFVSGDEGLVLVTADGGDSWKPRSVSTTEPIRAITFADRVRGLAAGSLGLLFATRDGGRSWTRIDLGTKAGISALGCFPKSGRCLVAGERGLLFAGNPFRRN